MSETLKNIYLPCVEPLLDTWAVTKRGGDWSITPSDDLSNTSVKERNIWYAEAMMSTLSAFSSFARAYLIYFDPLEKLDKLSQGETAENVVDGILIQWDFKEPYKKYLERAFQAVKNYPVDIYTIYVRIDLFVYVRTKESPDKPVRSWVRECGDNSYEMADIQIGIEHLMNNEPFLSFEMKHTLIYPFCHRSYDDNTELFELNRPLLEEALRSWKREFDVEIETDGLKGIYEYGFLPEDQW